MADISVKVQICNTTLYRFPSLQVVADYAHRATETHPSTTTTQAPTLCYFYGRLLLIVLTYALCPTLRIALWTQQHRELSFLKLVRYLQALADHWLQGLFAPITVLGAFLPQVCRHAARLVLKASRKRRPSAQCLRESIHTQNDCIKLTIKLVA